MALVKAVWRRTVQVKPYETETLELGVEKSASDQFGGDELVALAQGLDRILARAGDELVRERLAERVAEQPRSDLSAPTEPDPLV
jgi:hypothetical protein